MYPAQPATAAMTMAGLNLIQQALSIYDRDLRLAVCNRRFQEMFDLPDALVAPGAGFEDTIRHLVTRGEYGPVEDVEEAVRARVDIARAFRRHYMERTRANGRTISVEGSPLPQGGWVAVYTDITRIKRHEALLRARSEELSDQLLSHSEELAATNRRLQATITALEEAQRQLTASEARMRLTTEMMPAHIAHVGPDRRYSYSNRRLSAIMPGSKSEIIGLHVEEALGGEVYAAIRERLESAFAGKASVFEFTHAPSSRRIRAAFTPDESQGGVYILSMDVTEETQTRAALQQTRRREMAARLTSGMAHDFSNLLTIILGMQSRLQRMPLPAGAGALIGATISAARRGGRLLNRIGDMTSAREHDPRPTDLAAFLRDLETLALSTLPDDIRLVINNLCDAPAYRFDPDMLQDSLLNLVLNARDACTATGAGSKDGGSKDGGGKDGGGEDGGEDGRGGGNARGGGGRITLGVRALRGTWLEFSVEDTGPGFSPQALARGFEPFFTTKGGEGSGLGLAMVYDMTKLAGGRVELANTARGGRVILRLPLRPAEAPPPPGLVLLVEDSPDLRRAIRAMLREAGHAVIEAACAAEARALLRELPEITALLCDIALAGDETGIALLDSLPARPCPAVLMTSLPPDDPLYRAARARAPVLHKPFSATDLCAALLAAASP